MPDRLKLAAECLLDDSLFGAAHDGLESQVVHVEALQSFLHLVTNLLHHVAVDIHVVKPYHTLVDISVFLPKTVISQLMLHPESNLSSPLP